MGKLVGVFCLLVATAELLHGSANAGAIPVELERVAEGWQLLRGGEPYFIRGAGGSGSLPQLAAAGANSIRTWGADDLDPLLDEAHRLGLTVTIGIWLGHARHGFDYRDETQVREQFERARRTVLRYKDHPALLLWGIGNEMEGFEDGDDPAIWSAVNAIAGMVKQLDPAHPTMTVTAEIGGRRIASLAECCPAIDIHGINSYGGAPSLPDRYRAAGATRPYILTEFGHPGAWESPRTGWDAPIELTSSEKAEYYRRSYAAAVAGAPGLALGSYAFTWGYKMEATATWFGMFLADGARLAAIDTMTELWSGQPPANRAPIVQPLVARGATELDPGARLRVDAGASDPEGGELQVRWALRREDNEYSTGGDFRPMLPDIDGAILAAGNDHARVRMPQEPGAYRLFFQAYDDAGNAATANLPLLVKGKPGVPLPVYVYHDDLEGMPWVPSGWMGNIKALTIDGKYAENPHAGKHAIKLRYDGEFGWVGVAWQHPADNWGEQDGGHDLTGASSLELWARGEFGGERVSFGVGLIGQDAAFPDSGKHELRDIVLKPGWERYRVPLGKIDLSSIKTGFVVVIEGQRRPVTVHLDSIRFIR